MPPVCAIAKSGEKNMITQDIIDIIESRKHKSPITFQSSDIDGNWILVTPMQYLGLDKFLGFDEDGKPIVMDSSTLGQPVW